MLLLFCGLILYIILLNTVVERQDGNFVNFYNVFQAKMDTYIYHTVMSSERIDRAKSKRVKSFRGKTKLTFLKKIFYKKNVIEKKPFKIFLKHH